MTTSALANSVSVKLASVNPALAQSALADWAFGISALANMAAVKLALANVD